MGDKIAQLIFEKIKTPTIKETDELEGTRWGDNGYGSTGMDSTQIKNTQDFKTSNTGQSISIDQKEKIKSMNESVKKQSQLSQTRQIISAHQIQNLAKNDNLVFLAIRRSTNEVPKTRGKRSSNRAATFAAARRMTEGQKRKINRETSPKKNIISIAEQE